MKEDITARTGKHGRCLLLENEMFWRLIWRSPERVCVGEEGEVHSMSRDQRQKRHRNQQWKVWCKESVPWTAAVCLVHFGPILLFQVCLFYFWCYLLIDCLGPNPSYAVVLSHFLDLSLVTWRSNPAVQCPRFAISSQRFALSSSRYMPFLWPSRRQLEYHWLLTVIWTPRQGRWLIS